MDKIISIVMSLCLLMVSSCTGDEMRQMQERLRLLYFYSPMYECENGTIEIINVINDYADMDEHISRELLASAFINMYAVYCAHKDDAGKKKTVSNYIILLKRYKYCDDNMTDDNVDTFLRNYVRLTPPSFLKQKEDNGN